VYYGDFRGVFMGCILGILGVFQGNLGGI